MNLFTKLKLKWFFEDLINWIFIIFLFLFLGCIGIVLAVILSIVIVAVSVAAIPFVPFLLPALLIMPKRTTENTKKKS